MKKILLFSASVLLSQTMFSQATRNVLMEEYTGTWCVNCPSGHDTIEKQVALYPNRFINVGMHNNDAYTIPYETSMEAFVQVGGFPRATIDRVTFPGSNGFCMSRWFWSDAVAARINVTSPASLTINNGYDPANRQLTVKVDYSFLADVTEETNLTCVVLEDSIMANQTGATGTYTHMDVCRALLSSNYLGDANHPATVSANSNYTKTYTYTIPAAWNDKHLRVVAFINEKVGATPTLSTGTEILNSAVAPVIYGPLSTNTIQAPQFSVADVYPNPTSDLCGLEFTLEKDAHVNAVVTSLNGARVAELSNGKRSAGNHLVMWSGKGDKENSKVQPGVYFIQLQIGNQMINKPIILQ
jgi:hypothetical protein